MSIPYTSDSKIVTRATLQPLLAQWRLLGNKIVFTNGCFDLLHPGHTDYLEKAKALGNKLVLGLNSDRSVSALKGPTRPLVSENARAKVMAALQSVDAVVIFDEETPAELIAEVRPDVLVKGADYAENQIVGADFVKAHGGEVHRITFLEGYSTSAIVEKIKQS
jgi:rfaE bifunctional protein nucleotidyltransferase chain/domain